MRKKREEQIVIKRYDANEETGLTETQVGERVAQGLTNVDKSRASKSYLGIICKNVFTVFNILCFAVAGVLLSAGLIADCFFLIIVLANMIIGIIQEVRAKFMVGKLSLITTPMVKVVRSGKEAEIPVSSVVLDEVCRYETGNQIASDGHILSGMIYVNESMLTGESVDVKKLPGDPIFAGSFVTSGHAAAKCERVGKDNYISQLAMKAKKLKSNQSPILKTLSRIIRIITFALIPLGILVALRTYFATHDYIAIIGSTAGVLIGMIPSGMFLLTSLALAVGVIKLAVNKTLVQDLYCIEMLARCNVLCLDKTGTITDGTMKVSEVVTLNGGSESDLQKIISSVLSATGDNNSTAKALIDRFTNQSQMMPVRGYPFSSATKLSGASFKGVGTYVIGAAEFVLKDLPKELADRIETYAVKGLRVLLVAHSAEVATGDQLPENLSEIALIAIEDHIREEAIATIDWFKKNDVEIKIISGDNPVTVSHIAARVGVANADRFINLEGLGEEEVEKAANRYTVFGRVTPDQKAVLVRAMRKSRKTVAMTGDGVNDILAFKEADCSIAMASGSAAAKKVASIVLTDSNFANMPQVVKEGRRVVNNIQKSSSLYLMKNIFVFLVTLISLGRYPFSPRDLMLMEFFIIGIATFFLALQPNDNIIKGNFAVQLIKNAVPSAIVLVIDYLVIGTIGKLAPVTDRQTLTMMVITITFSAYMMLGIVCFPYNLYRSILVGAIGVCCIVAVFVLWDMFKFTSLELWQSLTVTLAVLLSLLLGVLLHFIAKKIKIKNEDIMIIENEIEENDQSKS